MQPITKKDLLDLINTELKNHPDHDGEILISDVKQTGHVFVFYADDMLNNPTKMLLAQELIRSLDPIFNGKFLLID
ncbi:hypothetical protein [Acinetobacter baumannii]